MSFYLFRRYFFSSRSGSLIRLVSWICLGGMAVSVAALIIIVSVMGGFGQAIKSRLLSKEAHLVVHFEDNPFSEQIGSDLHPAGLNNTSPLKGDSPKQNFSNDAKKSLFFNREEPPIIFSKLTQAQKESIKTALIFETQDLILKSAESFKGVSATGISQNQWDQKVGQISSWTKKENASPTFQTLDRNLQYNFTPLKPDLIKETLISYELSLAANLSPGDELTLIPMAGLLLPPNLPPPIKRFKVKGVLHDTENEAFAIYYKQGLMDFGDFSKINYKAEIQFNDPEQVSTYQNFFKDYKTQNWMERNSTLFFALQIEKFVMTLFLTLALIISCLGISSALFLLITQKGEDLAILHAMGLSQKEITRIFTGVGFSLALIGLITGALIGLSGTVFLKYNSWNILSEMYQDRTIPAVFMPFNYLIILSGALLLAWLSCYFPTKYLSKIKPAKLLKITGF